MGLDSTKCIFSDSLLACNKLPLLLPQVSHAKRIQLKRSRTAIAPISCFFFLQQTHTKFTTRNPGMQVVCFLSEYFAKFYLNYLICHENPEYKVNRTELFCHFERFGLSGTTVYCKDIYSPSIINL